MRYDWTDKDILKTYSLPLPELIFRAQTLHREHHTPNEVQLCTLLSIKTGGCPENCAYCPQSAHHASPVAKQPLMALDDVLQAATAARQSGATRFCMGAAWRQVRDNQEFERVLEMVRKVAQLGMEVCTTLGMLTESQAQRLKEAGVTAYNHNLDTGPDYYNNIVSTRTYEDRLQTLAAVRKAGMHMCCGGIIGMGEKLSDRMGLLGTLARMQPHPESVPINALVSVEGTPLENINPVDPIDMVRMIATARISMPASRVRLSAGRTSMSLETQALCFIAGANSIFTGDKLLTTPNPAEDTDKAMLNKLGLRAAKLQDDACQSPAA
jgi:biotin synthase